MNVYFCRLLDDAEPEQVSGRLTAKQAAQVYCDAVGDRSRLALTTVYVADEDGDPAGAWSVVDGRVEAGVAV